MTHAEQRALERSLVDALMKSLRPAMDGIIATFRRELAKALTMVAAQPVGGRGGGQLGRAKCCRVCGLKNARNDARLGASHTVDDHRRWKSGGRPVTKMPRRSTGAAHPAAAAAPARVAVS